MRYFLFFLVLLYSQGSYGQSGPVFLKWKIRSGDTVFYKTVMEDIHEKDFNLSFDLDALPGFFSDSNKKIGDAKRLFTEINNAFKDYDYIANLTANRKGFINVELRVKKKDTARQENTLPEAMMMGVGDVVLRGAVTEDGQIQSFYLKNDQKNLLALMFELPGKPVSVGDKWALDINLISMDQNFICDSSYRKNVVSLTELKKSNKGTIALIKYDILEYVTGDFKVPFGKRTETKTQMKMSFYGIAEFSVEKGRWISFDGILSLEASGVMNSKVVKKFTLVAN
jgi:hypothetical protein